MIRPAITCAVALIALVSATRAAHALQAGTRPAPSPAAARPLPHGAVRVQRTEIIDRQGFEKPLVAATMLIPVGWRTEGGVEWTAPGGCGPAHRYNWKATAPDGATGVQIIPEEKWLTSNYPDPGNTCLSAPITTTRQYLEWYVKRNRPNARVMDYRPRPDLIEKYQALNRTDQSGGGAELRSWVDAGELLIAYQAGGRAVRETIGSIGFFIRNRFPQVGPGPAIETLQGSTAPGFSMRAPEGALDFKMAEALRKSLQPGAEWSARINRAQNEQHRIAMESGRQMAETNRRAAADRSAIIAQTGREINDIQMGTWRSQNESSDRTQRESIESIRGVETYDDPHFGGSVQLSNQYQHAWQLNDGSYVLTDDVNFDPSRDFGVTGQRLKRTQ
ncbi:MAG: hypothetical protein ABI587_10405 [Gemmatimonadales bacterium]